MLQIGERALLVGFVACGEIRRIGPRRFAARDKRWRRLGEFATENAATRAIVRANEAANREAERAASPRPAPKAARPKQRRGRGAYLPRLPIGKSRAMAGPIFFGTVRHAMRRRYTAAAVDGRAAGTFTTLRRALDALRVDRASSRSGPSAHGVNRKSVAGAPTG